MSIDKENVDYKLENSYMGKLGIKVRRYVPIYSDEDKKHIKDEITKSCLKIYESIKNQ